MAQYFPRWLKKTLVSVTEEDVRDTAISFYTFPDSPTSTLLMHATFTIIVNNSTDDPDKQSDHENT
jgi:hypothetical protein